MAVSRRPPVNAFYSKKCPFIVSLTSKPVLSHVTVCSAIVPTPSDFSIIKQLRHIRPSASGSQAQDPNHHPVLQLWIRFCSQSMTLSSDVLQVFLAIGGLWGPRGPFCWPLDVPDSYTGIQWIWLLIHKLSDTSGPQFYNLTLRFFQTYWMDGIPFWWFI